MTPNEYRKKHRRCRTCAYFRGNPGYFKKDICEVKMTNKLRTSGRFCRVYKAKEFEE